MSRRPFICGNWKMNTLPREGLTLAADVARLCGHYRSVDIAIAPPFTHLTGIARRLEDSPISLAAQNVHAEAKGAFTAEISAPMLKGAGVRFVIVGHSERRAMFGETDAGVNAKVLALLAEGLSPIVCVGERLAERDAGQMLSVVEKQLRGALAGIEAAGSANITIAYEPVWAIGTGRTATPEQAQEVHGSIRSLLVELWGRPAAEAVRLQYGGSMKPANATELLAQPDVDGGLIGGAALDAESFEGIIKAAAAAAGVQG